MKKLFRRILGDLKLSFEELTTVLAQIEASLNSKPLTEVPEAGDGIKALIAGHFLIGRPIVALPGPYSSFLSMTLLWHWNLCQAFVHHFWQCWSDEYHCQLQRFAKWNTHQLIYKLAT